MIELAPIILFTYNRPDLLKSTIESLSKNILAEESILFVFSDGPKSTNDEIKVNQTRDIINNIQGFKSITKFFHKTNLGLADSIISGVSQIIKEFGSVIVLEDDLVTSPNFINFMNEALDNFKENKKVFAVSGYSHPVTAKEKIDDDVFFIPRIGSWGWATWEDRWNLTDWLVSDFEEFKKSKVQQKSFNRGGEDLTPMLKAQMANNINSWAIRWNYTLHKTGGLCLYPKVSKVNHIGNTPEGTHVPATDKYNVVIDSGKNKTNISCDVKSNEIILAEINELVKPSIIRKTINYFRYDLFS